MADIAFTQNGLKGWNKALERFGSHIGEVNSIHNKCFNMMVDLMNQSQSIRTFFDKHSEKEKNESRRRLSASIDVARFLLRLEMSFHGHDESVSSTNRDLLKQHQAAKLEELIISGKVHTGWGLNQERGLQRPCDTRWGSHYKTLENFIDIFSSILYVLEFVARECPNYLDRLTDETFKNTIKGFDFAFMLYLMLKVLMITNHFNSSLQKIDQDIVNALKLLNTAKEEFQRMKNSGWSSLLDDVYFFCDKYAIEIPKMDAHYIPGKSKRRALDELNNRFDVVSTDLLLGMACLHPAKSFGNFDKKKIIRFPEYYPNEFDSNKLRDLSCQLDNFIAHVRVSDKRFFHMKGITDLAKALVESELY
ncbi:uncharacterized protein LOC107871602 [Capsicum annuum]|uniref:uncharacterized protein LOC107871602 n=1 Tax=Capsicum annuum TaxID=4072 RepID=UPI001FB167C2|nr:uncharacterized protein LOC107871602 [Capsicum annuum]